MLRRLRIYFTGFGLGLIMVYFIFMRDDSRDLDIWTPSQRVLEDIRNDSVFQSSERLACFQDCLQLSDSLMQQLWKESDVSSLNPGGDPYRYAIVLKSSKLQLEAEVEKQTHFKITYLKDRLNPKACSCD